MRGSEKNLTEEERANAWQENWGSSDDLTDEAFADLILTFRAHANAALEAAAKVVEHNLPDAVHTAAAIRALRQEE